MIITTTACTAGARQQYAIGLTDTTMDSSSYGGLSMPLIVKLSIKKKGFSLDIKDVTRQ